MQFIILGAGAIGCYVGGRLAAGGQAVALVGRPRLLETLGRDGLTVTDLDGFHQHIPASALSLAPNLATACDRLTPGQPCVVLLCVKGGATLSAAQEIAACCPAGTPVISLQNGVDNVARIQSAAPTANALAGMVPYNVVMKDAHSVHRASAGHIFMARDAATTRIAPLMAAAGLANTLSDDMRAVQWGKLLLNLNNPVNALSDLPLKTQLMDRNFRRVLAALQTEALHVLAAAGIAPAKVGSVPPRWLPTLLRLPNSLFLRVAARMLRMDASARSSMWDDVQQGRITEIDDLCGAVVRLAVQHGTQAPLNAAMVQRMAAHQRGQRWLGADLYHQLHQPLASSRPSR